MKENLKYCPKCDQDKLIELFGKDKNTKDNLSCWCKRCKQKQSKEYYQNNKEYFKEYNNKYYQINRSNILKQQNEYDKTERGKEVNKKYRKTEKGKEINKQCSKKFRQSENGQKYIKDFFQSEKGKNCSRNAVKKYEQSEKGKNARKKSIQKRKENGKAIKYTNQYNKNRRKTNINFKIKSYLSTRIWNVLKGNSKSKRTLDLLGCSVEQFKEYLESLFFPGMTFENYGKLWEIDHYIPCVYFDFSIEENQKICFHFLNLRPLWSEDNHKKNDTLPEDYLDHIEYIKHWLNEQNKKVA